MHTGNQHSFDNLLPALARVHEELADAGGTAPRPSDGELEGWAAGICKRLMGVNPRPRVMTVWEDWVNKTHPRQHEEAIEFIM